MKQWKKLPERAVLYDLVWSRPVLEVAKEYGLSDRGLALVCRRENVPVPPRGYWARKKAGQSVERPALPDKQLVRPVELSLPAPPPPRSGRRAATEADPSQPHPLLRRAREFFLRARVCESGYLRPYKRALPDIFVSDGGLEQALELADALYKAFEHRRHPVGFATSGGGCRPTVDHRAPAKPLDYVPDKWSPDRVTGVSVGNVVFGLSLFEISENVEVERKRDRYVRRAPKPEPKRPRRVPSYEWIPKHDMPSGRFCVRAYSTHHCVPWQREWKESEPGTLLSKVGQIVTALEREAPTMAEAIAEANRQAAIEHERWVEQQRQWAIQRERERRAQITAESRKELLAMIDAWDFACRVEAFFDATERGIADEDEAERAPLLARLEEARGLLGGTDALSRFERWLAPTERFGARRPES